MELPFNLDWTQRLAIETFAMEWQPSPSPGVERIRLEREFQESGRATSLVRYAPNTFFKEHTHSGGEEIFVLSGEFRDENGVYPAGSYLRNPPGSKHSPGSVEGCTLFVKLGHFDPADTQTVRIDTNQRAWLPGRGDLKVMPLHEFGTENTALVHWPMGSRHVPHSHDGGEEILVLNGVFQDEFGNYPERTWLRNPHLSRHHPFSEQGCVIFVKVGHLNTSSADTIFQKSQRT